MQCGWRRLREIGIFDLHGDGFAADTVLFTVAPDLLGKRSEFRGREIELADIFAERVLGSNGLSDPVRLNLAIVDAADDAVEIWTRVAEMLLQEGKRYGFEIEAGLDPVFVHPLGGRVTDAVEFLTGSASTKAGPFFGVITA